MKKDRDCGNMPYPIYPPYQGMMPNMMMPNMMNSNMPIMNNQNLYQQPTTIEQQLSMLNNQVSSLEKRVSSLESMVGNKYNSSNFQIM